MANKTLGQNNPFAPRDSRGKAFMDAHSVQDADSPEFGEDDFAPERNVPQFDRHANRFGNDNGEAFYLPGDMQDPEIEYELDDMSEADVTKRTKDTAEESRRKINLVQRLADAGSKKTTINKRPALKKETGGTMYEKTTKPIYERRRMSDEEAFNSVIDGKAPAWGPADSEGLRAIDRSMNPSNSKAEARNVLTQHGWSEDEDNDDFLHHPVHGTVMLKSPIGGLGGNTKLGSFDHFPDGIGGKRKQYDSKHLVNFARNHSGMNERVGTLYEYIQSKMLDEAKKTTPSAPKKSSTTPSEPKSGSDDFHNILKAKGFSGVQKIAGNVIAYHHPNGEVLYVSPGGSWSHGTDRGSTRSSLLTHVNLL